ncbi:hypothetical protein K450DRAFT_240417 [Umbelopsis ramanniana AG]|uniref:DUF4188 domain-containing protein n=1 Tax=Umbelopsis ramanniana AG TaxID=1314678 RepID=A0AAD5HE87_UMBRA|nr:uncharacterized protein K450DRAFT_240417 [Umbelopsis ramanniana AG]KAI8579809.1 hypothetical protein K450DRAFT_240417 [Umbelopsis ramanniana AG]
MSYQNTSKTGQNRFGVFQSIDPILPLAAIFGSRALLGATLLASALLPRPLAAGAGVIALISAYRNAISFTFKSYLFPENPKKLTLGEKRSVNLDTNSTEPIPFRVAPVIKGDFCVFLIGFRVNGFARGGDSGWLGQAMSDMLAELQDQPELGCMNCDSYVSPNPLGGSTFLLVQYWRSYEQLVNYARGQDLKHYPAWMRVMKESKSNGALGGIWHETFKVRDGEYEGIYVNTPPFGLGKVGLVPAIGKMTTSKGRTGDSDGKDYLEGTDEAYTNLNKINVEVQKCPISGAEGAQCPVPHA